ncbi:MULTISPECIES: hypothetical protein [unclassified Tenacibaculum]|uniref:hypothetical protein n=1 Tax=unclassified Tenacibaculum TaxID=2635139 RepID=UPI001F42CFED|nr:MULTISPECIES: hypothetical protein [unclassified Tenacibaculum]MCF2876074.1 hypothetical protein [Tenacibaculum sp. Cn5-1]MCF2936149.1 hypothetical protein [Tenacibaculum sp. Cn5-34]MCG7512710.1 hypothetical protein [Tenacibaculum sp. Cn5-46]
MKKKYTITEKQVAFLYNYLKKKKSFSDEEERYELMDHLICDFEETTKDGNLSQYLADKSNFIFQYGKDRGSKIHWAYQKELWITTYRFFTNLKTLPISLLSTLVILSLSFTLSNSLLYLVFFCSIVFQILYSLYLTYHENKKVRQLISFKYLGNIMSLPQVFLFSFTLVKDYLNTHRILFFIYWFIAFSLSVAGLIIIEKKKTTILNKYKHLLK